MSPGSHIILKDKDGNHLISVDYFTIKNNAKYQFLTHAHKTDAISETWIKPIYCSRETAKILPTVTRGSSGTGVRSRFLRLLEEGQTTKLEKGLQVTVFDSNHCYGSVMFLFEGSKLEFSPVLCTGHFKADTHFFTRFNSAVQYEILRKIKIHTVYFDNKMINDDNFLSKNEVINEIVNLAACHPLAVCLLPLHTLGKEDILESISQTLNECVELFEARFDVYQIRSTFESVPGNFVEPSVGSVRIRAIPRNGVHLNDYLKNSSTANYLVCDISHSDNYKTITPASNYTQLRYTEHSSRSEVFEFFRKLRFENIVPMSGNLKPEDRASILAEVTERESLNAQLIDESTLFAPPVLLPDQPVKEPSFSVKTDTSTATTALPHTYAGQNSSNNSDGASSKPQVPTVTIVENTIIGTPEQSYSIHPKHNSISITNNIPPVSASTSSRGIGSEETINNNSTPVLNHDSSNIPTIPEHISAPNPAGPSLPTSAHNSGQSTNHTSAPITEHSVVHYEETGYNNFYPQPSTSNNPPNREGDGAYYNNDYYNMENQPKPCLSSWDSNYSEEPSTQRPVIILSHEPIPSEQYYEAPKFYSSHAENGEHQDYVPIELEDGEEIFITDDAMAEFFVPVSEDMMHGENIMITEYVGEASTSNLQSVPQEVDNFRMPALPQPAPKPKKKRLRIKRDDGLESVGEVVKANTKMLRLLEKIDREKAAEKNGESVLRRLSETENLNPSSRSIFRKEGTCIHNIAYTGICVDCILPAFDVSVLSPRKRNALKASTPLECGVRKKRCPNPSLF